MGVADFDDVAVWEGVGFDLFTAFGYDDQMANFFEKAKGIRN